MSRTERILLIFVGIFFLIVAGVGIIWLLPFIELGFLGIDNGKAKGLGLFIGAPGLLIVAVSLALGWRLLKAAGCDLRLLVCLGGGLLLLDGAFVFLTVMSEASFFWHVLVAVLAAMVPIIPGTWLLRLERKT